MLGEMRMESNIQNQEYTLPSGVLAILEPSPEGGYTAWIRDFPGANSQGETVEEALDMVSESYEELRAYQFAKSRNQVDADGKVRIGIADFQPVLNVGQTLKLTDEKE